MPASRRRASRTPGGREHAVESECVESEDCHRLSGSALDNELNVMLWIAKSDLSLKQIRESVLLPIENDLSNLRAEESIQNELWSTETTYQTIEFDGTHDLTKFEQEF
jgi:hypothetical protein